MRLPGHGMRSIKVGPGEYHVTDNTEVAIATLLGSCVAACMRDPVAGVGGLNHFMLPESSKGIWGRASASLRYGNFAMERLINDILARGGHRDRIEIKLFGGGCMAQDSGRIGERNADYVESYLRAEGLVPVVRELRGNRARRLVYHAVEGRAFIQELPTQHPGLADAEQRFRGVIPQHLTAGTVDIFD
jgi:chemotaxis protein CheD